MSAANDSVTVVFSAGPPLNEEAFTSLFLVPVAEAAVKTILLQVTPPSNLPAMAQPVTHTTVWEHRSAGVLKEPVCVYVCLLIEQKSNCSNSCNEACKPYQDRHTIRM